MAWDLAACRISKAPISRACPKPEVIEAAVNRVGSDLSKLLLAPTVEPFIGPAILSGRAAGVFFHEIFGHRVEGPSPER